jgi:glucosamine-6-phosphate deaminase
MLTEIGKDQLVIQIYETRKEMGEAAAAAVSEKINELLQQQTEVNIIFAAAPSQNESLAALLNYPIEWNRINAFHMDEYVNLDAAAPQGFGNFLRNAIFDRVTFKSVNFLNGNAENLQEECERYSALLVKYPTDVVCLGIGENAHIAFNDPHVADFNDPNLVKVVDLDEECRTQQVNDGCFAQLDEVPTHALTLTVPALIKAKFAYCVVPGPKKAKAVYHTLNDEISTHIPSTILREHPNAILFVDKDSASFIL